MQSLKSADHLNRTRIVLPDLIVFAASLACYLKLRSISTQSALGSQETQLIPGNPGASETFLGSTESYLHTVTKEKL